MDSFEYNKIAGAVLGTLTFTLGLSIFSEILFTSHAPAKPGYEIVVPEAPAAGGTAAPAAAAKPIAELLASADPTRGAEASKKCMSCHTFEKGGPAKVGPNLYGIVSLKRAHMEGFAYSAAMKSAGGEWTFENLNHFIANPKAAIPGTAMSFAGIKRDGERADLIAFLNKNSDNPQPLPTPTAEAPTADPAAGSNSGDGAPPAAAPPAEPGPAAPAGDTPVNPVSPGEASPAPAAPTGDAPAAAPAPAQ